MEKIYNKIFNVQEIEKDVVLQLFGGAILLGFWLCFYLWQNSQFTTIHAVETGQAACWPFFQNCTDWYFMTSRPYGYIQNTIFMAMLGIIFTCAYALLAKRFTLAHICIFILFVWQAFFMLMTYRYISNYYYYQIAFAIIFLFLPHKKFFGSLSIVLFYFLSTATKIHESWTLGTYFTNLQLGLPFIPDDVAPLLTNSLIFVEMIGAWFLFSKNKTLQRTIFSFFVLFHLYSGIFVGYNYPIIATPTLIIFFGPLFKPFDKIPLDRKSILGWLLCFMFLYLQMLSHMIPGDEKMTLEGNFYGHYMFEANHQCQIEIKESDGNIVHYEESSRSGKRCDPYLYWHQAKLKHCNNIKTKYHLTIMHSINGSAFYKIVDEPDLCALTYYPFYHNDWIKTQDEAIAVGRPLKNHY